MKEKILILLRERDGFVSGQELGECFGVSRTSVWKAISQLTEMGYEIEAVRNRGYRLLAEPDLLTPERVACCLHTEWAGRPVFVIDSVDSTNNEAKRRAEEGAAEGLLVIGEKQTAGRGRRGRVWLSEKGEGIFMSLLLRPDIEPGRASMLTLVMGLAVRDALAETCGRPDIGIKWPNDIVINGKKVCGILTEMSAESDCVNHIVIGVGVNVHNAFFPDDVAQVATSLYQQTGGHFCRAELIASCLARFEKYYVRFCRTQDLSGLLDAYNTHLVNRDRDVFVQGAPGAKSGTAGLSGTAQGINAWGELLVETPDGTRRVATGEVSVRGIYGYL